MLTLQTVEARLKSQVTAAHRPLGTNFTTLKQIEAYRWKGNHNADSAAFDAITRFVENEKIALADRAAAVRIAYESGMGEDRRDDLSDKQLVEDWLTEE